jgi:hypothetical protein
MRRLFLLAVGGAVGYLLGARAGRQRYDQIIDLTSKAWQQTGLDQRTRDIADQASQTARQAGDWVASNAEGSMSAARDAMGESSGSTPSTYPGTSSYHETQTTYPSTTP